MKRILVLGAGLSSSSLIKYLLDHSIENKWNVVVADISLETAQKKIDNHPNGKAIEFNINKSIQLKEEVAKSNLVVSMLPAFMHVIIAKECVSQGVHMLTASYVSDEMKALNGLAKEKGVVLLNELGVDPGIDHMSAMKVINEIKQKGGKLLDFKSNTGGLIAPEYDTNPWNYKFTWNPRNVVVAGQGVAQYKEEGKVKYIPYHRLFSRVENISVLDYGEFEVYPNRDSLKYRSIYGIDDIPGILRGTMRRPGYAKAWQIFVELGATDDSYKIDNSEKLTKRDFINLFLPYSATHSVEEKLANYVGIDLDSVEMEKLKWLGVFNNNPIEMEDASPAQILQKILEEKWGLEENDKDMIVMQHQFIYEQEEKKKKIKSSMVVLGKDTIHTAMSITVGTPLAIATKMVLNGEIKETGVQIPIIPEIYEPILKELKEYDIDFIEEEIEL